MSYEYLNLTELPPLPNYLTYLYCFINRLTTLPEQLPKFLKDLRCDYNRLTKLPEHLPNYLQTLWCWNNPFLFNLKTSILRFVGISYQNIESFNNYKILVILQRKIQRKIQTTTYFCRDITRLCNSF